MNAARFSGSLRPIWAIFESVVPCVWRVAVTNTLRITPVGFPGNALKVEFSDGRSIELPLNLFAKLRDASAEHRGQWRLIGKGLGIHWESVDEDMSLENLLLARSRIKGETYVRGGLV